MKNKLTHRVILRLMVFLLAISIGLIAIGQQTDTASASHCGPFVPPSLCHPTDSDGDGIPDYVDPSPYNPCIPFPSHPSCVGPGDSDGDGLPDYVDPDPFNPCVPFPSHPACAPPIPDADGDGWTADVDCDDANPLINPGATEIPDGIDNNCDGVLLPEEIDDDGDGVAEFEGDCDDADAARFPGNPEVVDGQDNDCDATTTPRGDVLVGSGVGGKGLLEAPGQLKDFNQKSQAAANAGKK